MLVIEAQSAGEGAVDAFLGLLDRLGARGIDSNCRAHAGSTDDPQLESATENRAEQQEGGQRQHHEGCHHQRRIALLAGLVAHQLLALQPLAQFAAQQLVNIRSCDHAAKSPP